MQKRYPTRNTLQVPGQIVGNGAPPRVRSLRNEAAGSRFQYAQFTVDAAPTDAGRYELQFSVIGIDAADSLVIYEHDATLLAAADPLAEVIDGLILAINRHAVIFGNVAQAAKGALPNEIVITGNKTDAESFQSLVITPSGAGPAALSAVTLVPASAGEMIGYGLFVGQMPNQDPLSAKLPVAGDASMRIMGVTMVTRSNEKNAIGPNAVSGYYPRDIMDVITHTLQNKGVVVQCVESVIDPAAPLFVSIDPASRGWLTTSGGIAIPNAHVESPVYYSEAQSLNSVVVSLM